MKFAAIWLANANSAVNVFIYSYTNAQFRRQCLQLASRLCCSRRSSTYYQFRRMKDVYVSTRPSGTQRPCTSTLVSVYST